jgi:hypothetical protein
MFLLFLGVGEIQAAYSVRSGESDVIESRRAAIRKKQPATQGGI